MRAYICQKKYVITFMVSLFIVISNSKQSKTSIHIKMDKLWHMHTNVYHAMVKKVNYMHQHVLTTDC